LIEDLKKAIYGYLTGSNVFSTAIGGRLYYIENTDELITYPYAVFQFISGDSDRDSGTRYENPIVQITIYDDSSSSIMISQIGKKLDTVFDESEGNITLTDYYVLGIDRVSPPREIRTFADSWQWSADYQIQLQKK